MYKINAEGIYVGTETDENTACITTTKKPNNPSDIWDFDAGEWITFGSKPEHGVASAAQFKDELKNMGLYDVVDTIIRTTPLFDYETYWDTAHQFTSGDHTLRLVLAKTGVSLNEVERMFVNAAKRTVTGNNV